MTTENEHSAKMPIIAIMYDFDKTLCTKDMQEYTFIPQVGMTAENFWKETAVLSSEKKMDKILCYMYLMLKKAQLADISIHRKDFVELGKDLEFFPGVEDWFERINSYGEREGAQIEHYIISSGLREIIEGSKIFKYFKEVFACEFLYNVNDVACWPKNAVNYTTKTQFLFRINKGLLDISDDGEVNRYTPEDDRRVPFRNMIYIGDGMTDVPCMKLVKTYGGTSFAVYPAGRRGIVTQLITDDRVNFIEPTDYSEGGELDSTIRKVIKKAALENYLNARTKEEKASQLRKI